jgi:hypothetical protein
MPRCKGAVILVRVLMPKSTLRRNIFTSGQLSNGCRKISSMARLSYHADAFCRNGRHTPSQARGGVQRGRGTHLR